MIVISGQTRIKPDKLNEAIQVFIQMQTASQAEVGCTHYRFSQDLEDPAVIHLFEEWESQEALDAHGQTPHMAQFREELPDVQAERFTIWRYTATSIT